MTRSSKSFTTTNDRRQFLGLTKGFLMGGASLVALTACAGPQERIIEYHYGLTPQLQPLSLASGQISIDRMTTNGIFAGRPIIERISTSPDRYVETRSKLWHSSPSDMVRDTIIKGWNQASDRQVVTSSLTRDAEYRLDIDIISIGYGNSGQGFVELRVVLTDAKRNILLEQHYDAAGPSAVGIDASVVSIETALGQAVNALGADITAATGS